MQLLQARLPIVGQDDSGNPAILGFQPDTVIVPRGQEEPYVTAGFQVGKLREGLPNASKILFPTPLRIARDDKELEKFNVREAAQRARAAARVSDAKKNEIVDLKRAYEELQAQLAELQAEKPAKPAKE